MRPFAVPSLAALAAAALLAPAPARAQGNLQIELRELAKDVKVLLDSRNESDIVVGQFVNSADLPASAGPAIAKTLADELTKLKINVKLRGANLTVRGNYQDIVDQGSQAVMVAVEFVETKTGRPVTNHQVKARGVHGEASVAALLGLTVHFPPGATPEERNRQLGGAIKDPKVDVKTTRIQAPGSKYALEILIKTGDGRYAPRPAGAKEGMAFVPIRRDESFAVRVVNDSDSEAAVLLTLDGLNQFTFSEVRGADGKPRYTHFIVGAHKSATVKGWHKNNQLYNEFVITAYDRSASSEAGLQSSANVGTITAVFSAAWPKGGQPPADEPKNPSEHARSADAVGRGIEGQQNLKEVERQFGVVRDTISVRYQK
jgi:hypothetical protein